MTEYIEFYKVPGVDASSRTEKIPCRFCGKPIAGDRTIGEAWGSINPKDIVLAAPGLKYHYRVCKDCISKDIEVIGKPIPNPADCFASFRF